MAKYSFICRDNNPLTEAAAVYLVQHLSQESENCGLMVRVQAQLTDFSTVQCN
jgi:hypothetical protein